MTGSIHRHISFWKCASVCFLILFSALFSSCTRPEISADYVVFSLRFVQYSEDGGDIIRVFREGEEFEVTEGVPFAFRIYSNHSSVKIVSLDHFDFLPDNFREGETYSVGSGGYVEFKVTNTAFSDPTDGYRFLKLTVEDPDTGYTETLGRKNFMDMTGVYFAHARRDVSLRIKNAPLFGEGLNDGSSSDVPLPVAVGGKDFVFEVSSKSSSLVVEDYSCPLDPTGSLLRKGGRIEFTDGVREFVLPSVRVNEDVFTDGLSLRLVLLEEETGTRYELSAPFFALTPLVVTVSAEGTVSSGGLPIVYSGTALKFNFKSNRSCHLTGYYAATDRTMYRSFVFRSGDGKEDIQMSEDTAFEPVQMKFNTTNGFSNYLVMESFTCESDFTDGLIFTFSDPMTRLSAQDALGSVELTTSAAMFSARVDAPAPESVTIGDILSGSDYTMSSDGSRVLLRHGGTAYFEVSYAPDWALNSFKVEVVSGTEAVEAEIVNGCLALTGKSKGGAAVVRVVSTKDPSVYGEISVYARKRLDVLINGTFGRVPSDGSKDYDNFFGIPKRFGFSVVTFKNYNEDGTPELGSSSNIVSSYESFPYLNLSASVSIDASPEEATGKTFLGGYVMNAYQVYEAYREMYSESYSLGAATIENITKLVNSSSDKAVGIFYDASNFDLPLLKSKSIDPIAPKSVFSWYGASSGRKTDSRPDKSFVIKTTAVNDTFSGISDNARKVPVRTLNCLMNSENRMLLSRWKTTLHTEKTLVYFYTNMGTMWEEYNVNLVVPEYNTDLYEVRYVIHYYKKTGFSSYDSTDSQDFYENNFWWYPFCDRNQLLYDPSTGKAL